MNINEIAYILIQKWNGEIKNTANKELHIFRNTLFSMRVRCNIFIEIIQFVIRLLAIISIIFVYSLNFFVATRVILLL
jgi:hypothetical protein